MPVLGHVSRNVPRLEHMPGYVLEHVPDRRVLDRHMLARYGLGYVLGIKNINFQRNFFNSQKMARKQIVLFLG